jgi:hypothetical protein
MPNPPIVLPIIITGLTLGSILASQTRRISKKKLASVSLISGLLNSVYAYVLYTFSPSPTFPGAGSAPSTFPGAGAGFRVMNQAGSITSFVISSFLTGFIFVIAVCGIALAYARFRGRKEREEEVEDETAPSDEELGRLEDA